MSGTPVKYPEHEKLKSICKESQVCGEFLDWLCGEKHFHLAQYRDQNNFLQHVHVSVPKLLAEFFEIDQEKLEAEKVAMLYELRCLGGEGIPR